MWTWQTILTHEIWCTTQWWQFEFLKARVKKAQYQTTTAQFAFPSLIQNVSNQSCSWSMSGFVAETFVSKRNKYRWNAKLNITILTNEFWCATQWWQFQFLKQCLCQKQNIGIRLLHQQFAIPSLIQTLSNQSPQKRITVRSPWITSTNNHTNTHEETHRTMHHLDPPPIPTRVFLSTRFQTIFPNHIKA